MRFARLGTLTLMTIAGLAACTIESRQVAEPTPEPSVAPPATAAPAQTIESRPVYDYTLLNREVSETPGKAQIRTDILVSEDISDVALEELLRWRYARELEETGFRYHSGPTVIRIQAFTSEEHVVNGQWAAILLKNANEPSPTVQIRERITDDDSVRFGYTEEERKEIYKRYVQAEDRADDDAIAEYGEDDPRWVDRSSELADQYKDDLARELGITRAQLEEIADEGFEKNWPLPPP